MTTEIMSERCWWVVKKRVVKNAPSPQNFIPGQSLAVFVTMKKFRELGLFKFQFTKASQTPHLIQGLPRIYL